MTRFHFHSFLVILTSANSRLNTILISTNSGLHIYTLLVIAKRFKLRFNLTKIVSLAPVMRQAVARSLRPSNHVTMATHTAALVFGKQIKDVKYSGKQMKFVKYFGKQIKIANNSAVGESRKKISHLLTDNYNPDGNSIAI